MKILLKSVFAVGVAYLYCNCAEAQTWQIAGVFNSALPSYSSNCDYRLRINDLDGPGLSFVMFPKKIDQVANGTGARLYFGSTIHELAQLASHGYLTVPSSTYYNGFGQSNASDGYIYFSMPTPAGLQGVDSLGAINYFNGPNGSADYLTPNLAPFSPAKAAKIVLESRCPLPAKALVEKGL